MPIESLESGPRGAVGAALEFRCDGEAQANGGEHSTPLLVQLPWPPSSISEARCRGWTVNAKEVLCPVCTGKRPRWPDDGQWETAYRQSYDDSHP